MAWGFRVPARDRTNVAISRGLSTDTVTLDKPIADVSNRCLVVAVTWYNSGGATTISAITFASVAMTHVVTEASGADKVAIYQLVAPATGIGTLSVTFSSAFAGTADDNVGLYAICLDGIDQSAPVRTSGSNSDASTASPAQALTSLVAGDTLVGVVKAWSGSTMRVHATAPDVHENSGDDSASDCSAVASYVATGSSETLNWAITQTSSVQVAAVAFKPAGGGAPTAFPDHYYRMMRAA